ncbi:unnamed protein product, partial [Ilex paraguariensis]
MACLNMFNNDQQAICTSLGPRISFSSDFSDTQQQITKHDTIYREAPVSSDFEFSVSGDSMITADELFFKGKLLPLKDNCAKMTLRDELLVEDDGDYEHVLPRLPKNSCRWKEKLGLKRNQIFLKKCNGNDKSLDSIDEVKEPVFVPREEIYAGDLT